MKIKKIEISERHLLDLIFYARRYCDNRSSYVSHDFNKIYMELKSEYPDSFRKDSFDGTLKDNGAFWPFAQDGMNKEVGSAFDSVWPFVQEGMNKEIGHAFDAVPKDKV